MPTEPFFELAEDQREATHSEIETVMRSHDPRQKVTPRDELATWRLRNGFTSIKDTVQKLADTVDGELAYSRISSANCARLEEALSLLLIATQIIERIEYEEEDF